MTHPTSCAPVLFLVFNRPERTRQVFEAIRAARPSRLFVAADGPRPARRDEAERCAAVRAIATAVDWPCELHTLFRDSNLGSGRAVSEAISWFFAQVSEGIVLEDDCLPDLSFFRFCTALLERYRTDRRVFKIAGTNPLGHWPGFEGSSYFYSSYGYSWGWASWSDRWATFDLKLADWPSFERSSHARHYPFSRQRNQGFRASQTNIIDAWDYQWHFAISRNHGLVAVPTLNLIRNIGFEPEATHTRNVFSLYARNPLGQLREPFRAPLFMLPDRPYERAMYRLIAREARREWLSRYWLRLKRLWR
jgi:hypothetical protein